MTHQELEKITGKEKREDIQIFILTHKPLDYELPNNKLYTPLQVGYNENTVAPIRDNMGEDNISDRNKLYAELTGHYFIYKNYVIPNPNLKYVGVCHYRRQLAFDENENFDGTFNEYDMVAPIPYSFPYTVSRQYEICHSAKDIPVAKEAISRYYPEYNEAFEKYIEKGHILYYSNSYVMKRNDYICFCEKLFGILEKISDMMDIHTDRQAREKAGREILRDERRNSDNRGRQEVTARSEKDLQPEQVNYQCQILTFLAERLTTMMIGAKSLCLIPFHKTEKC